MTESEEELKSLLMKVKEDTEKLRQSIKKRHHFAAKDLYSQSYGFSSSHIWMWELDHKEVLSTKELMLLNYGVREDSWESLGQQGDQTSQS